VSLIFSYRNSLKVLSLLSLMVLTTGCLPEEDDDDDIDISVLNGFWDGGFEQTETLRLLIYNGNVYGLDEDKVLFGTVIFPSDEEVDFSLSSYPFSYEDTTNFEFVSDRTATSYTINGLLATSTLVVADYETSTREYGSLELINDGTFSSNSSLTSLTGEWTTTDLVLNITSRGRFLGVNNGTDKDCSFEGQINIINSANSLVSLTMNRRNCDDFNGDSVGFAAINGDGELELYSKMGSQLLFMTFAASAVDTVIDTDTETDTEEDDEEETDTEEEAV